MAIQPLTSAPPASSISSQIPAAPRQSPVPGSTTEAITSASVTAASVSAASAPRQASKTELKEAVAKVEKVVAPAASNLVFSIDEDSGRTIVKVVDSSTKETIRQIPSEEVLEIARALDKLQGLLLRQTA